MPTKAKAWPEKLHFRTFSALTPTWLDLLEFFINQTISKAASLWYHPSVRTCLNTSAYVISQSTQVNFYHYPDRVATNTTQTLPTIFSINNSISILFPISDHSSSILISAFTIKTPTGPSTAFSRLSQTPSWEWLQDTTLAQKESCNNSFWFV